MTKMGEKSIDDCSKKLFTNIGSLFRSWQSY